MRSVVASGRTIFSYQEILAPQQHVELVRKGMQDKNFLMSLERAQIDCAENFIPTIEKKEQKNCTTHEHI